MNVRRLLPAVLLFAAGCRCAPAGFSSVDPGFRVETASLAFGRVLENTTATRKVTLVADSHTGVHVTVFSSAPFGAPTEVDIPGSGAVEVPVSFLAGQGPVTGELVLSVPGAEVKLALSGLGVRPLVCVPGAVCHRSTYDFEQDACVETALADDTACDPGNACLVQGRCRSGACLGVARDCDDANVCTVDGCAAGSGCVHAPRTCPPPANPCQVAVCDPGQGCGEAPAPDLAPCGSVDCVSAQVCVRGVCVSLPTPEGFECAPAVVCRPRSECHHQQCVAPDAGAWDLAWRLPLDYQVSGAHPELLATQGSLFLTACGLPGDADAGAPDASVTFDGGVACGLLSYTASGYERFATRSGDGQEGRLISASSAGVAVEVAGGVELRSRASGSRLAVLEGAHSLARQADGTFAGPRSVPDGGAELVFWSLDGGLQQEPLAWTAGALVATDEAQRLWALDGDGGVLWWRERVADGGALLASVGVPSGLNSLAVSAGRALLGGHLLVVLATDGGLPLVQELLDVDAGPATPLPREQLLGLGMGVVFRRQCPGPAACPPDEEVTVARVVDSAQGSLAWEQEVMPGGAGATLLDVALVDQVPGAIALVIRTAGDGGVRTSLEVFARGKQLLACPLPDEAKNARSALLGAGQLTVLTARGDGGATLVALPLDGLPLLQHGWFTPEGAAGTRQAAP